jgi:hypothetical protein
MAVVAKLIAAQLDDGGGANVCLDAASCKHSADTVVFDPTRICPSARLVADVIEFHGAARAKGWFFFNKTMLTRCSGNLCGGRFKFFIDREKGLCTIYSAKSTIPYYVCKVMDMVSIVTNRTYVHGDKQFVVEFHGSDEDVMNWVVSKSDEINPIPEKISIPLWNGASKDRMVMVSFLTHVPGYEDLGPQIVVFSTYESLVTKVIGRLMNLEVDKISDAAARESVRIYSDQYIELGGFVKLPGPVEGLLFEFIARACRRRALFAKISAGIENTALRQNSNAIDRALYGSMTTGIVAFMAATGQSLWNTLKGPLDMWSAMMKNHSWDVAIEPENECQSIEWYWNPATRGVPALGSLPSLWVGSRVDTALRPYVRQAWAWYQDKQTEGMFRCVDVETKPKEVALGVERNKALAKLTVAYGAGDAPLPTRLTEEVRDVVPPDLTPSHIVESPYSLMSENFDDNFPGLALCDMDVRSHLAATSDRSYDTTVLSERSKGFENPPRSMRVWETTLKCGVSGPRPSWAFETNRAFGKRVGGAPSYQHPLNVDKQCAEVFEHFARVCFRPGWKEVVKSRVAGGLWQPRKASVEAVLAKMQPSGVGKINAESFSLSGILMTEYDAMVKRQPKDKLDVSVAYEHSASQTIMFQPSKSTNAFFSSLMSEVNDCLDDCLVDHVIVNIRRDKIHAQRVWNRSKYRWCNVPEADVVDVDIGQCDKSHTEFNLTLYIYLLKQFGMPEDLVRFFEALLGRKRANAWDSHLANEFMWQVVSGLFYTIGVNSWVVAMANVRSLDLTAEQLGCMLVSGDDVLAALRVKKDLEKASYCFASLFNFEVKVFATKEPYWCGQYIVTIGGYDFFVKDPERIYSMLARYQPESYNVEEAFDSFVDDTKAYQWQECVEAVGRAAQARNKRATSLLPTAQGIASVRTSLELFRARMGRIRELSV